MGEAAPEPPAEPYLFELRILAQKPPFRVLRSDLNAEVFADLTVRYANPKLTLSGQRRAQARQLRAVRRALRAARRAGSPSMAKTSSIPLVSLYAMHKIGSRRNRRARRGTAQRAQGLVHALEPRHHRHRRPSSRSCSACAAATPASNIRTQAARRQASWRAPRPACSRRRCAVSSAVPSPWSPWTPGSTNLTQHAHSRGRAARPADRAAPRAAAPGGARSLHRGLRRTGRRVTNTVGTNAPPQSRGGGLLELRFPADLVGTVEYRPIQNWRVDVAWEP